MPVHDMFGHETEPQWAIAERESSYECCNDEPDDDADDCVPLEDDPDVICSKCYEPLEYDGTGDVYVCHNCRKIFSVGQMGQMIEVYGDK